MKSALFMNGKKCEEVTFFSEAVFENVVCQNFKTLFGENTIYFDLKSKVDTKTLGSTIPDGFLFDFRDVENPEFYLVEVELQKHDFYRHIFPQITKFFAFFKNSKSRNNLIERLFTFIKSNPEIKKEFKQYLGKREIYKALKDIVEDSQNILIILDETKPELKEVFETYTDTWDKIVKVLVLKKYTADENTIFCLDPDFEKIDFVELPVIRKETIGETYNENYHLQDVNPKIVGAYNKIKETMQNYDPKIIINPQKYYISLRKNKNFAFIKFRKTKLNIVILLSYEIGETLITNHKLTRLSQSVQNFYNGPCFRVTIDTETNLGEIIKTLQKSYTQHHKKK